MKSVNNYLDLFAKIEKFANNISILLLVLFIKMILLSLENKDI